MGCICWLRKKRASDTLFVLVLIVLTLYSAHNFYLYLFPDTFGHLTEFGEGLLPSFLHAGRNDDFTLPESASSADSSSFWPFVGSSSWPFSGSAHSTISNTNSRNSNNPGGNDCEIANATLASRSCPGKSKSAPPAHSPPPIALESAKKTGKTKSLKFRVSRLDSLEMFRWPLLLCSLLLFALLIWSYIEALRTPPGEVPLVFQQGAKHSAAIAMATFFEPLPALPKPPLVPSPSTGVLERACTAVRERIACEKLRSEWWKKGKTVEESSENPCGAPHALETEEVDHHRHHPSTNGTAIPVPLLLSSHFPQVVAGTRSAFPDVPPSIPASHIRVFSSFSLRQSPPLQKGAQKGKDMRRTSLLNAGRGLHFPGKKTIKPLLSSHFSTPVRAVTGSEEVVINVVNDESEETEKEEKRKEAETSKKEMEDAAEEDEEFFFNPTVNAYTSLSNRFLNYCPSCACYKPPRAHHCSYCRRCVLRYDHHCPWIGQCVGFYNYKNFLLLLLYTWLMTAWVLFVLIGARYAYWLEEREFQAVTGTVLTDAQIDEWAAHDEVAVGRPFFGVYVCFAEALLFFIMSSKLLRRHIFLARRNLSTIDVLIFKHNEKEKQKREGGGGKERDEESQAESESHLDVDLSSLACRNEERVEGKQGIRKCGKHELAMGTSGLAPSSLGGDENKGRATPPCLPPQLQRRSAQIKRASRIGESFAERLERKHVYNLGLRRNLLQIFGDAKCDNRCTIPHTSYLDCHCYRSLLENAEWEYSQFLVRWWWRLLPFPAYPPQRAWEAARGEHSHDTAGSLPSSFSYGGTSENMACRTNLTVSTDTADAWSSLPKDSSPSTSSSLWKSREDHILLREFQNVTEEHFLGLRFPTRYSVGLTDSTSTPPSPFSRSFFAATPS